MRAPYNISPPTELKCEKDNLCEKTADYMRALANEEFKVSRIARKYNDSLKTIQLQNSEINSLRSSLAKQWDDRFEEMRQQLELDLLKSRVDELVKFREHYESVLEMIERERSIDKEIQTEIEQMSGKQALSCSEDFIKEMLFLTEEEYDHISSE